MEHRVQVTFQMRWSKNI